MFGPLSFIVAVLAATAAWRWRHTPRHRTRTLAAATLLFWFAIDTRSGVALLGTTALCQFFVGRIDTHPQRSLRRRNWRRAGVASVISLMAAARFTPSIVDAAVEAGWVTWELNQWWQPFGAAVLALQAISYIVDVDRGDTERVSWLEAVLVCGFFPRALAGPIVRVESFVSQLRREWDGSIPLGEVSIRVVSAAVKRYVLAETLIRFDALTTAGNAELGRLDAVAHLVVGPLRFFLDVAAVTDLAIAAALCCGIRLPENFRRPFAQTSLSAMFRNWHATISGFFRDYVTVSITGLKPRKGRLFCGVVATFVLIGAWHHPTVGTMLWGVLFGVPVAWEALRRVGAQRSEKRSSRIRRMLQRAATFSYLALISPLLNGSTLAATWRAWQALANPWTATSMTSWWLVVCIVTAYLAGFGAFEQATAALRRVADRSPAWLVGAVAAVCVTVAGGLAGSAIPTFLYQRL